MYIKNKTIIRSFISRVVYRAQGILDNVGNPDDKRNGENAFVRSFCEDTKDRDIVFFDIGANIGKYTQVVIDARGAERVEAHLFEPQRECVKELHRKFDALKCVAINNFGLSDKEGDVTIYKDEEKGGLASVYKRDLAHLSIPMEMTESVSMRRPVDYLAEHGIKHIDLMKMDVEGHELHVLEGFGDFISAKTVDYVQFEYGGANLDSRTTLLELYHFFESRGFVVCKMMPSYLLRAPYDSRLENFQYQNFVAVSEVVFKELSK